MKLIGNVLWFVFTGFVSALAFLSIGLLLCITVIGIPFGVQCIKIAGLALWPFGKNVRSDFGKHPIANILWCIFAGWELAIAHLVVGLLWCITIIGIPFGKQCFKLMQLSFVPFGATVS